MARLIKDKIVRDNAAKLGKNKVYMDCLSSYSGEVDDQLEKVKLEKSIIDFRPIGITDSLAQKYDSLVVEGEPTIIVEDDQGNLINKKSVDVNVIRMLKALMIEQLSNSCIYSGVVSKLFYQLFIQVFSGKTEYSFECDENDDSISRLQRVIFKDMGDYIKETLNV